MVSFSRTSEPQVLLYQVEVRAACADEPARWEMSPEYRGSSSQTSTFPFHTLTTLLWLANTSNCAFCHFKRLFLDIRFTVCAPSESGLAIHPQYANQKSQINSVEHKGGISSLWPHWEGDKELCNVPRPKSIFCIPFFGLFYLLYLSF